MQVLTALKKHLQNEWLLIINKKRGENYGRKKHSGVWNLQ